MIVGVDFSTFAVHTAWVVEGEAPRRWHLELDGRPKRNLIDRVREVRLQWPADVEWVAIEYPVGRSRRTDKALCSVLGAITRSVPRQAGVAWPSTWQVRSAVGATADEKPAAHAALKMHFANPLDDWDEHELDALVVSLGFQIILNQQEEDV